MINELLDISKMEDGSLQLDCASVAPSELVQRALSQVEALVHEKQLKLQPEVAANVPTLVADAEKLVRVLVNLCGNAIKFTPSGGAITLRVQS
jgi:signal transduction histidine kinase